MRNATVDRVTKETKVSLTVELDGTGRYDNRTGCGFLDHMLELFAKHGRFDITVNCDGDAEVDFHHTTEDIGITLGSAFAQALSDMRGIRRYGSFILPMDEVLMLCAVDISGRSYLGFDVELPAEKVGDFDSELSREFMAAFSRSLKCTLHFKMIEGGNTHHIIEAMFKGFGRAMRQAVRIDPDFADEIPSTKGTLGGENA